MAQAAVVAREDRPGHKQLVGYVTREQSTMIRSDAGRDTDQIHDWRLFYDQVYGENKDVGNQEDFAAWNSNYDGRPIAIEYMLPWRSAMIDRILALKPRRVLEIGVKVRPDALADRPKIRSLFRHRLFREGHSGVAVRHR